MKPPGPKPRQDHPESGNAQANDARERPRGGKPERKTRAKETPDRGKAARSPHGAQSGKAMPATEAGRNAPSSRFIARDALQKDLGALAQPSRGLWVRVVIAVAAFGWDRLGSSVAR